MTSVVAVAAVAPIMAEPSVRAEQVTQLVMGETAQLVSRQGEWCSIRTDFDDYAGWVNDGYVRQLSADDADAWRRSAGARSGGAHLMIGRDLVSAPLRARLELDDGLVTLPDGRAGRLFDGVVRDAAEMAVSASATPPEVWALEYFRGSHYLWGGVTPLGVDCSGLVQTTFLLRGHPLPRDASQQALAGNPVALADVRPGDLLFFRSETGADHITHVAFLAEEQTLVHATLACGGVIQESFSAGSRAREALGPRLVAARRVG